MNIERFFNLFLEELKQSEAMVSYYKFQQNKNKFLFRKNYFIRRLEYILRHIGSTNNHIWDVGCGYGTTAIFLALNGYKVHGSTLELYFSEIEKRRSFWAQFGKIENFTYSYENIYDLPISKPRYDRIIVQDTLHHLEPVHSAINILASSLKPHGKMIIIEENGKNPLMRLKLFIIRGNKTIINIYDPNLKKDILLGNENVKSFDEWKEIFIKENLELKEYEYIRLFHPYLWSNEKYTNLVNWEKELLSRSKFLRNYFSWGLNFIATKSLKNEYN